MKRITIWLLTFLFCFPVLSSGYAFTHITTKNTSLSYDGITAITQDSRGFIWIGTYKGLNRYDGYTIKPYFKEDMGLQSDMVHSIAEDLEGNLWVGTDHGVTIYNYIHDTFVPLTHISDKGTSIKNKVTFIAVDNGGKVCMLVNDQGCFSYCPKTQLLENITYEELGMSGFRKMLINSDGSFYISRYHANLYHIDSSMSRISPIQTGEPPQDYFANDEIEGLFRSSDGHLYVASTQKGLSSVDIINKTAKTLFTLPKGVLLTHAHLQDESTFWFSTHTGVWKYDIHSGQTTLLQHDPQDIFSISDDYINCIYTDKDGGLWIGTKDGGVNYCGAYQNNFEKQYLADGKSLQGVLVSGFAEAPDGRIWVATEGGGFFIYDPESRRTTSFNNHAIPSRICSLCFDGKQLWFGTRNGLYKLDTGNGYVKQYGVLQCEQGIHDPNVYLIHKDSNDDILIGTTLGLFRYDRTRDKFIELRHFDGIFTTSAANDPKNPTDIWFSTFADGVLRWNIDSQKNLSIWSCHNRGGLLNDKVVSIFIDSRSRVWAIGFSNGIYRYDEQSRKFVRQEIPGLKSDVFFKALEDNNGNLWLASDAGLVQYDPESNDAYLYTERDGLLDSGFTNCALESSSGDMYFGSKNGFIRFNPQHLTNGPDMTNVVISSMQIGEEQAQFEQNIDLIKEITLKNDQNSFGFNFSILGLTLPSSRSIQCRLKGHEEHWRDILGKRSVFYYNIPPGQYDLEIRISDNENTWKEGHAPLRIIVKKTFWASPGGIILILLSICTFTLLVIFYERKHTLRKKEKEAEEFRKRKEEETFREKMNFFSHVIHEIKTPLTLIKTPLSSIMSRNDMDEDTVHDLEVMNNSAVYLTRLVNELLDYIRIEKMGFALKCEDIDIIEKLKSSIFNFSDTIRNNNLSLNFQPTPDKCIVYADSSALDKILNNLLLNAVKYAESSISLNVTIEDNNVIVKFANDGSVIPIEYREEIFKPFVQYQDNSKVHKSGVGIGLPLAKNLAKMHSGDLILEDLDDETCFILSLPVKESSEKGEQISRTEAEDESHQRNDLERILIADDNREFLDYLSSKIQKNYNTMTTADGKVAYKVLKENNIDLLISDISMPEMTGLELCEAVRKDIELSHIPIIIISARVSIESKIQAMQAGADLYIEKPFDMEYLQSSIHNILEKRRLMRNAFSNGLVKTDINMFGLPKKDEEFFSKFDAAIRENLSNNEFSNEDLAAYLNMSESTMVRKIRKLLNTSPNSYIRSIRLSVAAEMLKDSHGNNITEICYTVGFSSVSYFAKCFKEQYGMTPTEWASRT